jgi:hypothetical protein
MVACLLPHFVVSVLLLGPCNSILLLALHAHIMRTSCPLSPHTGSMSPSISTPSGLRLAFVIHIQSSSWPVRQGGIARKPGQKTHAFTMNVAERGLTHLVTSVSYEWQRCHPDRSRCVSITIAFAYMTCNFILVTNPRDYAHRPSYNYTVPFSVVYVYTVPVCLCAIADDRDPEFSIPYPESI